MTLVELLVVVAILLLLSSFVLPNLAGREGQRAVQSASANVSAQLAKAQSGSIARRAGRGIWLDPLTTTTTTACIDLYSADVPDAYRGDTFDAKFTVSPAASGTVAALTAAPAGCTACLASLGNFNNAGNLIQFNDVGPLYDFRMSSSGTWAVFRSTSNQTTANTTWPASAAANRFAIYRLPTRVGQPLTLAAGLAIDMAWSGVATQRFGTIALAGDGSATPLVTNDDWTFDPDYQLASSGTPAAVVALYDAAGSLAEMCYVGGASTTRFFPGGPLYLLLGRADRCGLPYNSAPTDASPGANWQYRDSRWIAVDPRTGIVKVAEPVVGASITTARQSQALIRAGLSSGTP
jgi:Tfp pilus assembly protein FimT